MKNKNINTKDITFVNMDNSKVFSINAFDNQNSFMSNMSLSNYNHLENQTSNQNLLSLGNQDNSKIFISQDASQNQKEKSDKELFIGKLQMKIQNLTNKLEKVPN